MATVQEKKYETSFPLGQSPAGGAYRYTRTRSPEFTALQNEILRLYDRDPKENTCLLGCSGLNALFLACWTCFCDREPGSVFLYSKRLYCDTPRILRMLQSQLGSRVELVVFDVRQSAAELEALFARYNDQICGVIVESSANPSGECVCFVTLLESMQKYCPYANLVVDNTWLSPVQFSPFKMLPEGWNRMLVVDSGSKYLSGGSAIWGHVTGNSLILGPAVDILCTMGLRMSPRDADVVLRMLPSLDARVALAQKHCAYLLEGLRWHSRVFRLVHLFLNQQRTMHRFAQVGYPKVFPATFVMAVAFESRNRGLKALEKLNQIRSENGIILATSFGKAHTLIDLYPQYLSISEYDQLPSPPEEKKVMWYRISAGYDNENVQTALTDLLRWLDEMDH